MKTFTWIIAAFVLCTSVVAEEEKEMAMSNSSYTTPDCKDCATRGGTACECGQKGRVEKRKKEVKQGEKRKSAAQKAME